MRGPFECLECNGDFHHRLRVQWTCFKKYNYAGGLAGTMAIHPELAHETACPAEIGDYVPCEAARRVSDNTATEGWWEDSLLPAFSL